MTLKLTADDWRALFPRAPQSVIDAFASPTGTMALNRAGILESKTRLAYALANIEHECMGFALPGLAENINYSAARMAAVWPNRFRDANHVRSKYGTASGWQKKAFDDIYGSRMGNRPGTSDGSRYIGRGGPQITGRDGYKQVGERCGLNLVDNPEWAGLPAHQPAILAGFWEWKGMNRYADKDDWKGAVRAWNGGTNGMADRLALMQGNAPIIARLGELHAATAALDEFPGAPVKPPIQPKAPNTRATATVAIAGVAVVGAKTAMDQYGIGGAVVVLIMALLVGFVLWRFWPTRRG